MKCHFVVGQKVVLVEDFSSDQRRSAPGDGIVLPELDVVYTVRKVSLFEGEPIIHLDEVINRPRFYADAFDVLEQGFKASRFAPVVGRKTDISIFKAMLNPTRSAVPA